MTQAEIQALVDKYVDQEAIGSFPAVSWNRFFPGTQYDDRSAEINYALVRHYKPKTVVEFGARTGRCTHDILKALIDNGGEFIMRSYELDPELRNIAQRAVDETIGPIITIGGDVMKADDIPDEIDYLFVDNSHDVEVTDWLFNSLIKKCKPGALVQIHDIPLTGDFGLGKAGEFPETDFILKLHREKKLPLQKLYWTFEEGKGMESSWWIYKPI